MSRHSRRKRLRAPDGRQPSLGIDGPAVPLEALPVSDASFDRGDRAALFFGNDRLDVYLRRTGQRVTLQVASLIDKVDVTTLMASYSPIGRHAVHPRIMLGLLAYGMMRGVSSLRALEDMARVDLGAIWICRGVQPDHSAIGKFVSRHAATLTEEFFDKFVRDLARKLGIKPGDAAIDGTVIESAASRFGTVRAEAARQAADQARTDADAVRGPTEPDAHDDPAGASAPSTEPSATEPDASDSRGDNDPPPAAQHPKAQRAERRAEQAERVAQIAEQRAAARDAKDGKGDTVRVSPTDPDAVIQPRKDGAVRPAYKPSVIATPERFIVGQCVHSASETAAVEDLLDQHAANLGADPKTIMLDAGYHSTKMAALFVTRELDALVPSGQAFDDAHFERKRSSNLFDKRQFRYDEKQDAYICPTDRLLRPRASVIDRHGKRYRPFVGQQCTDCTRRAECTASKVGVRKINRYDGEEFVAALDEVMRQPAARAKYRKRQAIVEPVFAGLRERLGLRRFRRKGLLRVRAEFTIYCFAYNLQRAVSIARRDAAPSGGGEHRRKGVVLILVVRIQLT